MSKAKRQKLGSMFSVVPKEDDAEPVKARRADREGRKATIFQLPDTAKKQLAYLSIEVEKTQQALLTEALNELFKKYGKPEIA